MNEIIFSIFVLAQIAIVSIFFLMLTDRMPQECRDLIARITGMLPTFGGKNPDIRSCAFLVIVFGMVIGLTVFIFH